LDVRALAPSAAGAVVPAAALGVVSGAWLAAPSGYRARIAPMSIQHQGTLVETVKVNSDEQFSNTGTTSAKGAGMAKSLRRSGGVPPRGRPV
jgi:hypothetical protein